MSNYQSRVLAESDGYKLVAGVVHAHTTCSDGENTLNDLVRFAHSKGLGIVCITDHHFNDWRYRWGLRLNKPSVIQFGIAQYFAAIREAEMESCGPIVVPGIEIMPHYRWEGIPPFLRCEAMKNFVVYGIDDPEIIQNLPVRLDGKGKSEAEAVEIAQRVISYLRLHGGLVYWSHLEQDERFPFFTAEMRYRPRPYLLEQTSEYSGFGCFPEGYRETCQPGAIWDRLLEANVQAGKYTGPWVLGEADYHSGDRDEPYRNICNPTTVFSLRELDRHDVIAALTNGRMYAYMGHSFTQSVLHVYRASDPESGRIARSGETLHSSVQPTLEVSLRGFPAGCLIRLICAGKLLVEEKTRELTTQLPKPQGAGYACRIQAVSPEGEQILTNPIFIIPGR
jgi:PHP domain